MATRMENKREKRARVKIIIVRLLILYVVATAFAYGYFMSKENDRLKEKIFNYDSESKVYYLKEEIKRGEY